MDIRTLTPDFSVAPQITPDEVPAIAAAGFRTVVCNRPDNEVDASLVSARMREAVEAAGMTWAENVFSSNAMTLGHVSEQARLAQASEGPVLAYCRTGTRSAMAWALGQAGQLGVDDILRATTAAGYAMDGLRPQIEALAAQTA